MATGSAAGAYQQVNVPLKTMSVPDFRQLADSPEYATPTHSSHEELAAIYWDKMVDHAGIYGADVCGTITDPDVEHWNINKLGTILDYVGKDYNMSIDGVNTAYLYFGMWKTTFAWHTEDMDLYSINYLHCGAPKTWYSIPPSFGRKFEKLAASVFPKSAAVCRSFLRHKMTVMHPSWLSDYDIPYDTITQEAGQFMITFPFGYHLGFNHGFNCAESTNFAIERWVEYGKHASICNCCPDAVKISMDAFVKRFQPSLFEAWKAGKDGTPHPEYHVNPQELALQAVGKKMSFKERNPDLNINSILENPHIPNYVKVELNGSFLVSAEEEVAGLIADFNEPDRKSALQKFYGDSSDEDRPKKRRRKKHDSDYDDDWYVTKGHELISEDGKVVKNVGAGRPVRTRQSTGRKTLSPQVATSTTKAKKSLAVTNPKKVVEKALPVPPSLNGAKCKSSSSPSLMQLLTSCSFPVTVIETKERKITVMSAKPSSLPPLLELPKVEPKVKKPTGPSYNDAFAQFLAGNSKPRDEEETLSPMKQSQVTHEAKETPKITIHPNQQSSPPCKIQEPFVQQDKSPPAVVTIVQKKQEAWTSKVLEQTQSQLKKKQLATTEKVKTERIQPYVSGQNQLYTNQMRSENGQQIFYTIATSTTTSSPQRLVKVNGKGYEQKQQS